MFRRYIQLPGWQANLTPEQRAEAVLSLEPLAVTFLAETAWQVGGRSASYLPDSAPQWYSGGFGNHLRALVGVPFRQGPGQVMWDHLIYAYLIENTRIFEIFHRVLWELTHGERLGIPLNPNTFRWLRTTEELFYKDASPFQPRSMVSRIRPDIRAGRRNAYYRMFGMDLNHGDDAGGAYRYEKATAANRDFVPTLEELLRQVWIGIQYAGNQVGSNPTDDAGIANLALRLRNMLIARRGSRFDGGFLAREEFDYVTTMAWLHLTVLFDTPIVQDLRVIAPSPEERLRLIGDRVGIPAHARAHSYFILAPELSVLLTEIEAGLYTTPVQARVLYALQVNNAPNPIREMLMTIITHWSMVTGVDLKATRVDIARPAGASRDGTGYAARPAPTGAPGRNGRVPADVTAPG